MKAVLSVALLAGLLAAAAQASFGAGDVQAGRAKAAQCAACHGIDGMSKLPEAPNLAGQTEEYLVKALNDFRSGERKNEMMSMMAKTLSDADVANLAAYYHSLGKQ
ncbi:MAG TPA: cytochrome c [Xanthobacteraceae bacterium]